MFGNCSIAKKRYRTKLQRLMFTYLLVLVSCSWLVRHKQPADRWVVYLLSVIPSIPVILLIVSMGQYLREESDEFQRQQTVTAMLVGTGAMLSLLVVDDFLRSYTPTPAYPPFVLFVVFFVGLGVTQLVQAIRNRPADDAGEAR